MAYITRARSDLNSGALVRLSDEFGVNRDGFVSYDARYCCLEQFASGHAATFKVGAFPPEPRSKKLSAEYGMISLPSLVDIQAQTENGLVYFDASYSALATSTSSNLSSSSSSSNQGTIGIIGGEEVISSTNGSQSSLIPIESSALVPNIEALNLNNLAKESTATITTDQRSLSGSFEYQQEADTVEIKYSFDYISTSITLETVNGGVPNFTFPYPGALVSEPFNLRMEPLIIKTLQILSLYRSSFRISGLPSTRITYTSGGKTTALLTFSGIYVAA